MQPTRTEPYRTVPSRAEPYRTMQWKSAIWEPVSRDERRQHASHSEQNTINLHEKKLLRGTHVYQPLIFLKRAELFCALLFLAPLPRYVSLYSFICFYLFTICLCKRTFCENSSTSSLSPSLEKDRRSVEPFLWGEEPRGGLPISESGRWGILIPPSDPSASLSGSVAGAARTLVKTPSSKRVPPPPPGSEAYAVEATHNAGSLHASLPVRPSHKLCVSPLVI